VHDDRSFGSAQAPLPCAAALSQELFKNRKLIRHLQSLIGQSDLSLVSLQGQDLEKMAKLHERAFGPLARRLSLITFMMLRGLRDKAT
jgi:hypothetical protein